MNVKWPITVSVKETLNEVIMKILHHFCLWCNSFSPNHIVLRLLNSPRGILLDNITQALYLLSPKDKYHLMAAHGILPAGVPLVFEGKQR